MPLTSKQRVRAAFAGEVVDRPPFIPLLGVVVSRYMQIPLKDLYSSSTQLTNSLQACHSLFRYDAVTNPVDPTLEAEACGRLDYQDVPPLETQGRIPIIREVLGRLTKTLGKDTAILATITGPFTMARRLVGDEAWQKDVAQRAAWAERAAQAVLRLCKTYLELQVDSIILTDPELPLQDVSLYSSVQESLDTLVNLVQYYDSRLVLSAPGVPISNLPEVLSMGPTAFALGNSIPLDVISEEAERRGLGFAGTVSGDVMVKNGDTLKECVRRMIETAGKRGFFVTTEGEVPPSTPADSIHAICQTLAAP